MIKGYKWRNIKKRQLEFLNSFENQKTMIVFDTETTGLPNPLEGIYEDDIKIIQFSAILYEINYDSGNMNLTEKDTLNLYINPGELLDEEITEITGITNELLASADFEDVAVQKIVNFMKRSNLWVAYNTAFDLKRLEGMRNRTGCKFLLPGEGEDAPKSYDILFMVRESVEPNSILNYKKENNIKRRGIFKLDILTPMLLSNFEASFHNALDDVKASAMVLSYLYSRFINLEANIGEEKLKLVKFSYDIATPYNLMKSRRIIVYVEDKEANDGAIGQKCSVYWDVSGMGWSCENTKDAKALFKRLDLADLENQIFELAIQKKYYGKTNQFEIPTMDNIHIEASNEWKNTKNGKWKLKQAKKIAEERKINLKNSEFETLFKDIGID